MKKTRREFIRITAAAATVAVAGKSVAAPSVAGVKAGYVLVRQDDPSKTVDPAELKPMQAVAALVVDPATKQGPSGNKGWVIVFKVDDAKKLTPEQKPNAAGDIVAYSGVCPHQGCPTKEIGSVGSAKGKIICICHGSQFDPYSGKKGAGPSPRGLSALPIKIEGNTLVATGDFKGKVGVGK